MIAPSRTPTTTPPATMLSRKFLSEGEIPGWTASATSGTTIAAARAAAVNPATTWSFDDDDALTMSRSPRRTMPVTGALSVGFDELAKAPTVVSGNRKRQVGGERGFATVNAVVADAIREASPSGGSNAVEERKDVCSSKEWRNNGRAKLRDWVLDDSLPRQYSDPLWRLMVVS
ncbi:hypothetical protein HPP92_016198 [Vanilla planifolia]|uniref:Uncharacterized protein n=1 Tax=Vanilla planifolia TaxID=51239 RepID=A0A835QDN5_VANPL|nr:hypothetical protein HPP92_016198 [Vanilla planifolia]